MMRPLLLRVLLMVCGLLAIAADDTGSPAPPPLSNPVISSHAFAPFGTVHVARPPGAPRGVVLFLSDAQGITAREEVVADALARRGLLVALVSTPALLAHADDWSKRCLNANYPLVDLSNDVQHRMGVRAYMKPIIMGQGMGGTLAYATLSQWANGSYTGAVSLGYLPALAAPKSWCTAPGFSAEPIGTGKDWRFGPNRRIRLPWVALYTRAQAPAVEPLVRGVPHARAVALPGDTDRWPDLVARTAEGLLPRPPAPAQAGSLPIPDMPLTIVPPARTGANGDLMAILYSGDGGWVGIDRDVAGQLAAAGIPVVGVDSLAYFWTARTPAGAGADLRQLIDAFSRHWHRPRVLLVGYSFGADALPHMVAHLDPATRAKLVRLSLLGLSGTADFQFHLSSWLDISADNALPTIPAITRLRGLPMQCVRGEGESDSACPEIPGGLAAQFLVPGGHHFDRNAALLAQIILDHRRPGTVSE